MKSILITITSLLAGMVMTVTGNQNFIDTQIEYETNNEFVVEFNENVEYDSSAVAIVKNIVEGNGNDTPLSVFLCFFRRRRIIQ